MVRTGSLTGAMEYRREGPGNRERKTHQKKPRRGQSPTVGLKSAEGSDQRAGSKYC